MSSSISLKELLRAQRAHPEGVPIITWTRAEWQAWCDERAAIYEHDGGWPPKHARVLALQDALTTLDMNLLMATGSVWDLNSRVNRDVNSTSLIVPGTN